MNRIAKLIKAKTIDFTQVLIQNYKAIGLNETTAVIVAKLYYLADENDNFLELEKLAKEVMKLCQESNSNFSFSYEVEDSIPEKLHDIATKIYGASGVKFTENLNAKRVSYAKDLMRQKLSVSEVAAKCGAEIFLPPLKLCGDNGAMIGAQAYYNYEAGILADESLNAHATSPFSFKSE